MPRYARRALANVTYHIIHRGNNKQVIFFCDDDFQYFLRLIKIAKTEYEMNLYSYVLMNNHVHFLLEPLVKEHLAKFIKSIAQKYAQYVNKKYKRTGTLWEGRFRSSPVS
ncbi:transposase, partial [Candidatus Desantisbacteria bacterium CG_4_9_14_3_um_filter_50_7]